MAENPKVSPSEITPGAEAPGISACAQASAGERAEKGPRTLSILSIDGGGVRGIIPARILTYLEGELQRIEKNNDRRLADYFDLIVGTSTGGLIAAMITTKRPPDDRPMSARNVLQFYKKNAALIFPPHKRFAKRVLKRIADCFTTKDDDKGLDELLKINFGTRKLSDACTNVIIPSFDIKRQQPVFFSSWETKFKDISVRDVCRATTAAPTFFSPVEFTASADVRLILPEPEPKEEPDTDEEPDPKEDRLNQGDDTQATFNMIDGGIAANNPTYVGVTQALRHCGNVEELAKQNGSRQLLVLSLGTGRHRMGYSAEVAKHWGEIDWLEYKGYTPLINSLQNASADMVDYDLSMMFRAQSDNYLRIQTDLPLNQRELSELDNADADNLKNLDNLAKKLLEGRVSNVNFQTGKLVYSESTKKNKDASTNKKALTSFAETLRDLHDDGRRPDLFPAT